MAPAHETGDQSRWVLACPEDEIMRAEGHCQQFLSVCRDQFEIDTIVLRIGFQVINVTGEGFGLVEGTFQIHITRETTMDPQRGQQFDLVFASDRVQTREVVLVRAYRKIQAVDQDHGGFDGGAGKDGFDFGIQVADYREMLVDVFP